MAQDLQDKIARMQAIADRGLVDKLSPDKRKIFDEAVKRKLVTYEPQVENAQAQVAETPQPEVPKTALGFIGNQINDYKESLSRFVNAATNPAETVAGLRDFVSGTLYPDLLPENARIADAERTRWMQNIKHPIDSAYKGMFTMAEDLSAPLGFTKYGRMLNPHVLATEGLAIPGRNIGRTVADRLYGSALKSSNADANTYSRKKALIETGLREGIVPGVSGMYKGAKKIYNNTKLVEDLVESAISNNPNARFDGQAALGPLRDEYSKLQTKPELALKERSLAEIERGLVDDNRINNFSFKDANDLKKEIYSDYKNSYERSPFVKESPEKVLGWKAVARGLKEQIETLHPEIKKANWNTKEMKSLLKEIERISKHKMNANLIPYGVERSAILGAAMNKLGVAGTLITVKELLDAPSVKGRLAIAIDRMSSTRDKPTGKRLPPDRKMRAAVSIGAQQGQKINDNDIYTGVGL